MLRAEGAKEVEFKKVVPHRWSVHVWGRADMGRPTSFISKTPIWEGADTLVEALRHGEQPGTRAEYEELRRIHQLIDSAEMPGLSAVRPLAYDPDSNTIVMEAFNGRRLDAAWWRPGEAVRIREAFAKVGKWVALRSDIEATEAAFDPDAFERDLDQIAAGSRDRAELVALCRRLAEELRGRPMLEGRLHGDLTPSNVLVGTGGDVAVIDPNLPRGWVLEDLATMAVSSRVHRWRAVTWGLLPRPSAIEGWEQSLIDGFGSVPEDEWRWAMAWTTLRRWAFASETRWGGGFWARVAGGLIGRRYEAEVDRLSAGA